MPTSYALGEHFEQFIKAQLASGRYTNGSEVVREALRLLEDQEKLRVIRLEELRAAIKAGIDSGPGHPIDEVWAGLKAKYEAQLEDGQR